MKLSVSVHTITTLLAFGAFVATWVNNVKYVTQDLSLRPELMGLPRFNFLVHGFRAFFAEATPSGNFTAQYIYMTLMWGFATLILIFVKEGWERWRNAKRSTFFKFILLALEVAGFSLIGGMCIGVSVVFPAYIYLFEPKNLFGIKQKDRVGWGCTVAFLAVAVLSVAELAPPVIHLLVRSGVAGAYERVMSEVGTTFVTRSLAWDLLFFCLTAGLYVVMDCTSRQRMIGAYADVLAKSGGPRHGPSKADPAKLLKNAFIVTTYDEEEKGTKLVARPAQTLVVADGCIQWNKKGEIIRRLKLSDLTDVFVASKSLVPTVLPAKKDAADRCVSVRGVNGSLHAEFESAEQLNTWIVALHSLIQSSGKQVAEDVAGISMFTIIFGSAAVGAAILFSGSAFLPTYLVFRELFLQRPAVAEVKVKDS